MNAYEIGGISRAKIKRTAQSLDVMFMNLTLLSSSQGCEEETLSGMLKIIG